jgi:hypothetical protein
MSVPYSMIPSTLLLDQDMTLSAVRTWHVIYCETLGRPGWDLSYQQIAEKIGTKRRQTAMDAVDLLLQKGWLIRTRQKDAKGDSAPNLYAVCREPFVRWSAQGGTPDDTTPTAQVVRRGATPGGAPERTHQENHLPGEEDQHTAPTPAAPSPRVLKAPHPRPTEFSDQSAAIADRPSTAQTILKDYLDWRKAQGGNTPPPNIIARLGKAIKESIDTGVPTATIKRGLNAWHREGNSPASLPAFIDKAGRSGVCAGEDSVDKARRLGIA